MKVSFVKTWIQLEIIIISQLKHRRYVPHVLSYVLYICIYGIKVVKISRGLLIRGERKEKEKKVKTIREGIYSNYMKHITYFAKYFENIFTNSLL